MTVKRVRSVDLAALAHRSTEGLCELLLVRHGEQGIDESMSLGAALDAPLSELGRKQALAVGERLSNAKIHAVYSSDLSRAFDTAREIARHHGLDPVVDPNLREIDIWQKAPQDKGLLDIHSPEELVEIFREVFRSRRNSAYPYCEDVPAFHDRIRTTIDSIIDAHIGDRVVVACHGGVINSYLAGLLGSEYDYLVAVQHTSISTVRAADKRRAVLAINDYAHVLEAQGLREWA